VAARVDAESDLIAAASYVSVRLEINVLAATTGRRDQRRSLVPVRHMNESILAVLPVQVDDAKAHPCRDRYQGIRPLLPPSLDDRQVAARILESVDRVRPLVRSLVAWRVPAGKYRESGGSVFKGGLA
jgi:hypothetical protein